MKTDNEIKIEVEFSVIDAIDSEISQLNRMKNSISSIYFVELYNWLEVELEELSNRKKKKELFVKKMIRIEKLKKLL